MSRFVYAAILLVTSLLLGSQAVIARDTGPAKITGRQGDALIAFFQGEAGLVGELKAFPLASPGELEPILATTGVHCVLASKAESQHQIQYLVGSGSTSHRLVVSFTLLPPVTPGRSGTSLASLLTNRQVTQYQIWSSSSATASHNRVVAFSSRSKHSGCGYAG